MKELGDLCGCVVLERGKACITVRKVIFLGCMPKSLEFVSGSWKATESEFCLNNDSVSDLERRDEVYKVQSKKILHFGKVRELRQRCGIILRV